MTSYRRFRSGILILLGFSGLFSGCHRGEPLRLDHPRLIADVAMSDITFRSTALDREMTYRVFLPAKIDAGQKLPVVYLLHGNGGGYRDWSNNSDVARYAAKGLILVMPEGHASYFMNAVERPRDKYEDYLIRDLVADVESRFPGPRWSWQPRDCRSFDGRIRCYRTWFASSGDVCFCWGDQSGDRCAGETL